MPLLYWYNTPMRSPIESLLLSEVKLPGQYIGGELGSIVKPKDSVKGRLCLVRTSKAVGLRINNLSIFLISHIVF